MLVRMCIAGSVGLAPLNNNTTAPMALQVPQDSRAGGGDGVGKVDPTASDDPRGGASSG